jgi:hypothetical protein
VKTNGRTHHLPRYDKELLRGEKDRLVFEVLRSVKGLSNTEAASTACAPATIAAWRRPLSQKGTRYPRAITMNAVLHAHGKKLGVVDL